MAEPPQDIDTEALAEQVVKELDPGSVVNDKVVLSRRQLLALTGGGAGLAALGFGTGTASAADGTNDTSVGDVGAAGDSVDVYLDQLRDPGGDVVVNVDDTGYINASAREWLFGGVDVDGTDIDDGGTTVYDASTGTVGDGTTSADHQSINTGSIETSNQSLKDVLDTDDSSGSLSVSTNDTSYLSYEIRYATPDMGGGDPAVLATMDTTSNVYDYEYQNGTQVTGDSKFRLYDRQASDNFGSYIGEWRVVRGENDGTAIFGSGAIGTNLSGRTVTRGAVDRTNWSEMTVETNSSTKGKLVLLGVTKR